MSDEELAGLMTSSSSIQERELFFEEIFRRYQAMVYRCAYGMLREENGAEDVTQEVFLRIARALGRQHPGSSFRGNSSLKTWIYSIVLNTSRTALKRKLRELDKRLQFEMEKRLENKHFDPTATSQLSGNLLDCLPAEQREVVLLWVEEDLPHREIAKILGIPTATVSWRIFQAKKRIRKLLSEGQSERVSK